jgi:hypothetical protein
VTTPGRRFRATALVAASALAVHELRYLLAPVAAGHTHRHAYLTALMPLAGVLLALLLGRLLVGMAGRRPTPRRRQSHSALGLWGAAALTLLVVYIAQESLEGSLGGGPLGLATLTTGGGWLALPLSFCLGAVVAFVLGGLEEPLPALSGPTRLTPLAARPEPARLIGLVSGAARRPLARHLAGRAPPLPLGS